MTDFDRQLHRALERRQPPRDLKDAIMSRLDRAPARRRFPQWRPLLAAAACTLVLMGGLDRYQEYRRGQQAKQQLIVALEITAQKLAVAEEKIGELNHRRIGRHD